MRKLTPKQEKFCLEYVKVGFTGQAYINAGYKAKNKVIAEANGRRLLEKDYIKNRINELMEEVKSKDIADAEEVLKYLTKGMRMELEEEVVVTENIGDYMSEAKLVKKKISIKDANKCAELLGKRYRLFIDKVEADVNANVNSTKKLDSILEQLDGDDNE